MNPYKGLKTYQEEDSKYFWGRANELSSLFEQVNSRKNTILSGMSGSGKSSLINAGLIPKLKDNGYIPIRVTPNEAIVNSLMDIWKYLSNKMRQTIEDYSIKIIPHNGVTISYKDCGLLDKLNLFDYKDEFEFNVSFVFIIEDMLRSEPKLFFEKRVPQKPLDFNSDKSIMEQIKEKDRLISLPYESIQPFLTLLSDAAKDPNVVSIRMTLYRLAKNSKVVEALVEAAENGKQVDVLVELKARFDEQNNIRWSRRLEEAGCHVIYGLDNLKVHSKLCLITRRGKEGVEYITQIGTGNYNEKTARQYEEEILDLEKGSQIHD